MKDDKRAPGWRGSVGGPLKAGDVIPLAELLGRRDFCRGAIAGAALLVVPACSGSGYSSVGTGPIDDTGDNPPTGDPNAPPPDMARAPNEPPPDLAHNPNNPPPDLAHNPNNPPPDLAHATPPDMAHGVVANCPGGTSDTGTTPAQVAVGSAVYLGDQIASFLCRDAGGLYGMSAVCTHNGCIIDFVSSSLGFHCPCHNATFSFVGDVTRSPAFQPLVHYALCLMQNGNVGIDTSGATVGKTTRYNL
jgi:Rieske Fe-S protein